MVLLHFKIGEKNQFIYEVPATTPITDVIKGGIQINNLRCKIDTLCMVIEELLKHGPLKTEETRGLKETENLDENLEPQYRAPKTKMPEKVLKQKCLKKWVLNTTKIKQIKEQDGY